MSLEILIIEGQVMPNFLLQSTVYVYISICVEQSRMNLVIAILPTAQSPVVVGKEKEALTQ